MITLKEYFGDTKIADLTLEQLHNALDLLHSVNALRAAWGKPMVVTSGYRSPEHNAKIGGAPNSNHVKCAAIDIADADGKLKQALMANDNAWLKQYDLYMEHPKDTPTWAHLQIVPPKSGNRVFGK